MAVAELLTGAIIFAFLKSEKKRQERRDAQYELTPSEKRTSELLFEMSKLDLCRLAERKERYYPKRSGIMDKRIMAEQVALREGFHLRGYIYFRQNEVEAEKAKEFNALTDERRPWIDNCKFGWDITEKTDIYPADYSSEEKYRDAVQSWMDENWSTLYDIVGLKADECESKEDYLEKGHEKMLMLRQFDCYNKSWNSDRGENSRLLMRNMILACEEIWDSAPVPTYSSETNDEYPSEEMEMICQESVAKLEARDRAVYLALSYRDSKELVQRLRENRHISIDTKDDLWEKESAFSTFFSFFNTFGDDKKFIQYVDEKLARYGYTQRDIVSYYKSMKKKQKEEQKSAFRKKLRQKLKKWFSC